MNLQLLLLQLWSERTAWYPYLWSKIGVLWKHILKVLLHSWLATLEIVMNEDFQKIYSIHTFWSRVKVKTHDFANWGWGYQTIKFDITNWFYNSDSCQSLSSEKWNCLPSSPWIYFVNNSIFFCSQSLILWYLELIQQKGCISFKTCRLADQDLNSTI